MQTTRAIVLRSVRYSDNRVIVTFFSEIYGIMSAPVRINPSGKKGCRSAMMQVLTLVELCLDFKPSAELQKTKDVQIISPWKDIPYNPVKASVAMFLGDLLYHCLWSEGANSDLFAFIENSLDWLDEAESGYANFHLVFMVRLTRFMGFLPCSDGYKKGMVYDLKNASFSTVIPTHGQYLDENESRWVSLILNMHYSQMSRLRMSRNERWHMLDVLLRYYRLHVPAFGELQSLDILRELFS